MKVYWKCGLISEVELNITKVADLPYPTIEKKAVEHITKAKSYVAETYVINGKPLLWPVPGRQVASIRCAQEAVMNLVILEPKVYEADVPYVFGYRSIAEEKRLKRGAENDCSENCAKGLT